MNACLKWIRSVVGGALLGLVIAAPGMHPRPAAAHANLVQSDPPAQSSVTRAPAQIQMLFSEAVEPRFVEVSVLDKDRKQVDAGDARLAAGTNDSVVASLGDLPPGVYTISWKMVSAVDGHQTRGLIPFSVGDAGAVPEPLSAAEIGAATSGTSSIQSGPAGVAARWLMLLSMLALGGVLVAVPALVRPAAARLASMRGGKDDTAVAADLPDRVIGTMLRQAMQILAIALVLFAVGSLALLLIDAAAASDTSVAGAIGAPVVDLLGTRRGVLWLVRVVLAIALAAALFLSPLRRGRLPSAVQSWGMAAIVAAMLLATSLGSHSASLKEWGSVSTFADWVHLGATSIWIGGLIFLVGAFLPAQRPLAGPARTRLLADIVPRFSTIALLAVGVIVVTGIFQTWRLLDRLGDLTTLEWGRALLIKVGLVLLLVALGAVNLLIIKPRLAGYAQRMDRATRERAAGLRLTFRRVVMTEAVIGVVVVLVAGVLTGVSPAPVTVAGPTGPFRPFILDQSSEGMKGRLVLSPGRIGNNRFDLTVTKDGGSLPADTSAVLRITTLDQETGTTEAPMETLGGGRFTTAGSFLSTVGLWEIAAVVRQPGRDDVILPFALSLTESTGRPQTEEQRPAAPLARGRELYQANCVQCHGGGGRGDGPLAAGLRPPPLDLTVHVPLHSDQELANWITNGVPRTSMPAWGGQFTAEETQAVINYLRELARQSGQER